MRQIFIIICLVLCTALVACDKNDDLNAPEELPGWMKAKVDEVITNKELCPITQVTIIQYNNELYYHLYCAIWSCSHCYLYNSKGENVFGQSFDFETFMKEKKEIKTISACQ